MWGFIPTQGQVFTLLLSPLQRATELAALCDIRWKRVHCPTHPLGSWSVFWAVLITTLVLHMHTHRRAAASYPHSVTKGKLQLGEPFIPCMGLIVSLKRGRSGKKRVGRSLTPPLSFEWGQAGVNIQCFSDYMLALRGPPGSGEIRLKYRPSMDNFGQVSWLTT